ncbi:hypothetical protein AB4369_09470 [Vibrio sp. 10N.261.49.A5]|uniref:Uncharacterized protein n=1 Tax=Vibrio tasmaniensis 1F-267 TaxID=1191324 RepID=A0ABX3B7U6_9VIBR|nr:hypothetical protein [Vibrio tasmaniensis]OEF51048.1 hypothetical protein A163_19885 [Vibrio tasmaniensis 1F-267]
MSKESVDLREVSLAELEINAGLRANKAGAKQKNMSFSLYLAGLCILLGSKSQVHIFTGMGRKEISDHIERLDKYELAIEGAEQLPINGKFSEYVAAPQECPLTIKFWLSQIVTSFENQLTGSGKYRITSNEVGTTLHEEVAIESCILGEPETLSLTELRKKHKTTPRTNGLERAKSDQCSNRYSELLRSLVKVKKQSHSL